MHIDVTDADFQEKVIEKSKEVPVVVDFWATWCMPCLMISPVLDKLSEEYKGKFILAKVNVDDKQILRNNEHTNGKDVQGWKDNRRVRRSNTRTCHKTMVGKEY